MTFLVKKDCVDIVFKIRKGVYFTVQISALSKGRLLFTYTWGNFWNHLKGIFNRNQVLAKLQKSCPLSANIFVNTIAPHFVYVDSEQTEAATVVEIKAPVMTDCIYQTICTNKWWLRRWS